jgi:hypothetical protein
MSGCRAFILAKIDAEMLDEHGQAGVRPESEDQSIDMSKALYFQVSVE